MLKVSFLDVDVVSFSADVGSTNVVDVVTSKIFVVSCIIELVSENKVVSLSVAVVSHIDVEDETSSWTDVVEDVIVEGLSVFKSFGVVNEEVVSVVIAVVTAVAVGDVGVDSFVVFVV